MNHSVTEVLLAELYLLGVRYVFLVPGAQISPLIFQLYNESELKIPEPIIANHELAAGFMAIGYARTSGKMGVAISIGGPAAAYMLGAGVTAKIDEVPVLFITGNIPTDSFGLGEFQDASSGGTNDSAVFQEAIGCSLICNNANDLNDIISQIRRANEELKPIHVQVPVNIQKAVFTIDIQKGIALSETNTQHRLIKDKKTRKVLLIGHKALRAIDTSKLIKCVKQNQIGIVTDIKSRGVLSEIQKESLGYIGFNSDVRALEVFNAESSMVAEQIVTVGMNESLIGKYINLTKVERIKVDPAEINNWLDNFYFEQDDVNNRKKWLAELATLASPQAKQIKYKNKLSYSELIGNLKKSMPLETIYCLDSGQIRRAGSIFLTSYLPRTLLQSETLSPMGLGICSSIGAQLAAPDKHVVCLFGDGSMRMNGIELATAVRYSLPIIFILCDNNSYASTKAPDLAKELPYVDWKQYGNSIGIETHYIDNGEYFQRKLQDSLKKIEPILLWIKVPCLLDEELSEPEKVESKNWLSTI